MGLGIIKLYGVRNDFEENRNTKVEAVIQKTINGPYVGVWNKHNRIAKEAAFVKKFP